MLIQLSVLECSGETVSAAVQDICKGLHLVALILPRNRHFCEQVYISENITGANLKLIFRAGCGIELINRCAFTAVNFHALIISPPKSKGKKANGKKDKVEDESAQIEAKEATASPEPTQTPATEPSTTTESSGRTELGSD